MGSIIGKALAQAGLLPPEAVKQFKRWNPDAVGDIEPSDIPDEPKPIDEIVPQICGVMTAKEQVDIRETNLEVDQIFKQTKVTAVLHLVDDNQSGNIDVEVGRLLTGEFLLPWSSEGIEDIMTNGRTCLQIGQAPSVREVYFSDVRDLYFGDSKAFMVCTPVTKLQNEALR
jgi:hypothetical protein